MTGNSSNGTGQQGSYPPGGLTFLLYTQNTGPESMITSVACSRCDTDGLRRGLDLCNQKRTHQVAIGMLGEGGAAAVASQLLLSVPVGLPPGSLAQLLLGLVQLLLQVPGLPAAPKGLGGAELKLL